MGNMRELNRAGDTRVMWDKDNDDEVAAAQKQFCDRLDEGWSAYEVGLGGKKGTKLVAFDASAGEIVLVPPIQGG